MHQHEIYLRENCVTRFYVAEHREARKETSAATSTILGVIGGAWIILASGKFSSCYGTRCEEMAAKLRSTRQLAIRKVPRDRAALIWVWMMSYFLEFRLPFTKIGDRGIYTTRVRRSLSLILSNGNLWQAGWERSLTRVLTRRFLYYRFPDIEPVNLKRLLI